MSDIEQFLAPIPGGNPAGEDLRYSALYDTIREARRQGDTGPMGLWEREAKTADFKQVIKLSEDALLKKTKDLQIAAWLTEGWIYRDGVPGLTSGIGLLRELIERFWENVHPGLEDGDAELRARPLDWLGSYFDPGKGSSPVLALRSVPLTDSGFSWFIYQESRRIGYEADVKGNKARAEYRQFAVEEKKVTPEEFDRSVEDTGKPFYKQLEQDCKEATEALGQFDALAREKFGDVAPSFASLEKALEEVGNVVHILLLKKLEKEPDVAEPVPDARSGGELTVEAGQPVQATITPVDLSKLEGGSIGNTEQALLHVIAAAQFLREKSPASPVPYLLLRALRWGEVRGGAENGLTDLPAPAPEVRMTLRASASGKNWARVLDAAEAAMSNAVGRGWLDLQRYSIKACDELGYAVTAKALRSELKTLLADFPQLANATLNDDTGAANPETLAWLRQEGLLS
ncbi:MAG: type VI secretion system protein TssA [Acidobacteriaceae bacterium]|nr:type VI secretion system protein TssA [Acidobacteriaceae bacterium]MBV9296217.1 type VI secretion system protein TssA [Acidobacteriaceae bacterium]MBV9765858.1 type VI secretion system protein TssA [Acidobacteriaceae bacterium]